jgi:hypothetical protein
VFERSRGLPTHNLRNRFQQTGHACLHSNAQFIATLANIQALFDVDVRLTCGQFEDFLM